MTVTLRDDAAYMRMKHALTLALLVGCGGAPSPAPVAAPAPTMAKHTDDHHTHHDHQNHQGHHGGGMDHGFKNADEWAKVFDDPARDAWQEPDRIVAAMTLTPAMTVVDIGAGTGYFAVRIARVLTHGEVIATDLEPDMIRYLGERAQREGIKNLRGVLTPADDPQLRPGSVDRILVADVWHHLGDRDAYARKLVSSLRQGGQIIIVDFKLDATRGPPPQFRIAPKELIVELEAVGLTATVAFELADQYVITARRK